MDRRRFIWTTVLATPAALLVACRRRQPAAAGGVLPEEQRGPGQGRVFDEAQWLTLEAACARLMPSDREPGAREANVVNYIDAQLALPHFATFRQLFTTMLPELDRLAQSSGAPSFRQATAAQQDRVLQALERGVARGPRRRGGQFFRVLLTFTLEGFLGDPVYGGNRNEIGWRLIGFQPRPPRPRGPFRSMG